MGFFKYVKAAFVNRWNLLAFLGALGLAALGPMPDVTIPLVLAGEAAYLGLLSAHPRFRKHVDAQAAAKARGLGTETAESAMRRILNSLPRAALQRFDALRARCAGLRQLAAALRDPHQAGAPQPFEELQLASLDKLLWIYLRLLFTQHALERFLHEADEQQIQADVARLERQLAQLPENQSDTQKEKMRKALEDNLATSWARLENLRKARDNFQLVLLEIDRLENKIRAISEMAVNRHEPDFISAQVDQVAESMVQTERTMGELQFLTGLETSEEDVPVMLRRDVHTA